MKKIAILSLIILAACSCKKDVIVTATPKLLSCNIGYLVFNEDLQKLNGNSINYTPSDTSGTFCTYSYKDGTLIWSTGGMVPIPSGMNLNNKLFMTDAYDSIEVVDNSVYVFSKWKFENAIHPRPYAPATYLLDSQKRLLRITEHLNGGTDNIYEYTYSNNLITETSNISASRKFYFENNNLVKVLTEFPNLQGVVGKKIEILFHNFDNKPNPFKNMYYAEGAFYRAFSANNYEAYTMSESMRNPDGTFSTIYTFSVTMPILYNADGYPRFGKYE